VIAAVASAVIAGFVASRAPAKSSSTSADCKTLNLLVWEGYADPSYVKPFEKKYGVTIKATYISTEDQELAKMVAGGTKLYDVITASSDNRKQLIDAGVIQPLDVSRIPNYKAVFPFLKPTYQVNGKTWSVAQDWGVNPFVYSKKAFKKPPTSWQVMFDPNLKGKLGIWGDYSIVYVGASLLGYDKNPKQLFNLSQKQLDAIKAKMLELKPQIRKVWSTGGDLIQLFANGEVVGSLGWNYIYQQLALKKFPIGQVVFKDHGAEGWIDANSISTGIKKECVDFAYKWINYMTTAKVGAQLANVTGYAVAVPGAVKHMPKELVKSTSMDRPYEYVKGAIIKVDPVNRQAYLKTSEEIIAGLGGG
jgi:putative spermidine/putrescine transport system substrate-binding protein/spermidine/putrescine transport system substrate-binding protein